MPAVVDNTFATPLNQQPLALGATVVVHSATKLLAGHSDVIAGAAVTANADLAARITDHRTVTGAVLGPMEAYLTCGACAPWPCAWRERNRPPCTWRSGWPPTRR